MLVLSYGSRMERRLEEVVSRRGFLTLGVIITGGAILETVGCFGGSSQDTPYELQLDLQPKTELSDTLSQLSNDGWRVRRAPNSQEYRVLGDAIPIDNGFAFHFGRGFIGDNGIRLRALGDENGAVVTFLRVTPLEDGPLDYTLRTSFNDKKELVTEPVVFENSRTGAVYYTQFKPIIRENKFAFLGYYLQPRKNAR